MLYIGTKDLNFVGEKKPMQILRPGKNAGTQDDRCASLALLRLGDQLT